MALTIAEVMQEMQVPLATRLRVPLNPFYAIGGEPPTSDSVQICDGSPRPRYSYPNAGELRNIH